MITSKPKEPSVPIFITKQENLKTKKSVVIILNDHMQDLGVWAYREICTTGFDAGSATGTLKNIKLKYHSTEAEPGVVILNPGQYYYSYKEKRALTHESWEALPRKTLFHSTIRPDETLNAVPGSGSWNEHVSTVFEKIVLNEAYINKDADLYFMSICASSNDLLKYFNEHWSALTPRVIAVAFTHPHAQTEDLSPEVTKFIETRSRAWMLSSAPLGTCVGMPEMSPKIAPLDPDAPRNWEDQEEHKWLESYACPTFSGGEEEWTECVFPKVQNEMLKFFKEVRSGGTEYVNPAFEAVKLVVEQGEFGIEAGDEGNVLKVEDVNKQGDVLPPSSTTVENVTEQVKKVQLADDEVEVAGVAVPKDLLAKAGLD
jgi:hypothetical protein